jgi:hypothetical protein
VGSEAATSPVASDPASLIGGGGSDAAMYAVAPDLLRGLWCAACPTALDPASLRGALQAVTRPTVLCGPWATCKNKSQAGLPVQQKLDCSQRMRARFQGA